jgi:uncharacterized protein
MRFALVILLAIGCSNPAPVATATTTAADPVPSATETTGPRVIFPDGFVVKVEIAADDERRAQGLMYRDRLDPGHGMLFLFPNDNVLAFWMKNTRIPLDMIFLDSNRRIVGIVESAPPCKFDPCPSYGPNAIARYVLEVAGGQAKAHGLKAGDVLTFEKTSDIPVH